MDKYLPLGTVVVLKGGNKRLMIYGRRQINAKTKKIYDYVGCLFPEGNMTPDYSYMFNHENIEDIYFIGLKDDEERKFVKVLKSIDTKKDEPNKDNLERREQSNKVNSNMSAFR